MSVLDFIAYLASASIICAYFNSISTGRQVIFHFANAVGGIPLLAVEMLGEVWPVVPLTLAFTVLGFFGLAKADRSE